MLRLRSILNSSRAAIDLASIMVGVIIIGLIGGVIAATVFAVIPWSQDKAAKQQLEAIATAENAQYGKSADNGNTPVYGDSATLSTNGWLQPGDNYCVVTPDAAKKTYEAAVKSASGKIFVATNTNPNPKEAPTNSTTCIGVGTGTDAPGSGTPTTPPTDVIANALPAGMSESIHMAINKGGKIYAWGYNNAGQVGDGTTTDKVGPATVLDGTFTQITGGYRYSVALKDDNTLWAWGINTNGWLAFPGEKANVLTPRQVPTQGGPLEGKTIKQVVGGEFSYYVLTTDNKVYISASGLTTSSSFKEIDFSKTTLPGKTIKKIVTTPVLSSNIFALATDGTIYAQGSGTSYIRLDKNGTIHGVPTDILPVTGTPLEGKTVVDLVGGGGSLMALTSDNKLYGWGKNSSRMLSAAVGSTVAEINTVGTPLEGKTISTMSLGQTHSLILTSDGKIYATGDNSTGQLGNNRVAYTQPNFVEVSKANMGNSPVKAIQATNGASFALTEEGKLYAWGSNANGRLGIPGSGPSIPVEVSIP
jgi:alpha-tubulin suppressor-like RCC1 family protein